jgi:hypothetical protein
LLNANPNEFPLQTECKRESIFILIEKEFDKTTNPLFQSFKLYFAYVITLIEIFDKYIVIRDGVGAMTQGTTLFFHLRKT